MCDVLVWVLYRHAISVLYLFFIRYILYISMISTVIYIVKLLLWDFAICRDKVVVDLVILKWRARDAFKLSDVLYILSLQLSAYSYSTQLIYYMRGYNCGCWYYNYRKISNLFFSYIFCNSLPIRTLHNSGVRGF